MFTYFLCNDEDTIYRIEFSIDEKEKDSFLSLLNNYLEEFIFVEQNTFRKLINDGSSETENNEVVSLNDGQLSLEKNIVLNIEKLEEYLPSLVTIKTKKYFFLRPYTIYMLVMLLSEDIKNSNNARLKDLFNLFASNKGYYFSFSYIYEFFFNDGKLLSEKTFDYNSLKSLMDVLNIHISRYYSMNELSCFWAGDDMERASADGIVDSAKSNQKYITLSGFNADKFICK